MASLSSSTQPPNPEYETWVDIPTYEGIYQASTFGRIRTPEGKTTHSVRHGTRLWKSRILKNKTKVALKEGYKVTLWKDKKPKDLLVARVICAAFHGMPEDFLEKHSKVKLTVNHKDGNRFNNHPENLEWMTIGENIQHALDTGLYDSHKNPVKLSGRVGIRAFKSHDEASRSLGRCHGYVNGRIKKNKRTAFDIFGNEYIIGD